MWTSLATRAYFVSHVRVHTLQQAAHDPMTDDTDDTREAANTLRALADARDADIAVLDDALNSALADARDWEEQLAIALKQIAELERELADLRDMFAQMDKLMRGYVPIR